MPQIHFEIPTVNTVTLQPSHTEGTVVLDNRAQDAALYAHTAQLSRLLNEALAQPAAARAPHADEIYDIFDPIDNWPVNYHRVSEISRIALTNNMQVKLEDGSYWQLEDVFGDSYTWLLSDPITIRPNAWPFNTVYPYQFKNENTGQILNARPTLVGPEVYGAHSHQVAAIDQVFGYVYLDNGSKWTTSFFDDSILSSWKAGDYIIVGNNPSGYYYDSILINYNTNEYVRAHETY